MRSPLASGPRMSNFDKVGAAAFAARLKSVRW